MTVGEAPWVLSTNHVSVAVQPLNHVSNTLDIYIYIYIYICIDGRRLSHAAGGHLRGRHDGRRGPVGPLDRAHLCCGATPQPQTPYTLVTGPRRSLSLKLSDTRVYEP